MAEDFESLREIMRLHVVAVDERLTAEIKLTNSRFDSCAQEDAGIQRCVETHALYNVAQRDAIRELLGSQLDAQVALTAEKFRANAVAVEKAQVATERRFESVNEFRAQLSDIQQTLLPRAEAEARMSTLAEQISNIKSIVDKGFTGSEVRATLGKEHWGYIVGAIGMLAVVGTLIVTAMHMHLGH